MLRKNGAAFWVDEHNFLSCFVCVCSIHLSNTGILTLQDLRCLPFPLKLSQASFLSPGLTLFSRRYNRAAFPPGWPWLGVVFWALQMVPELPFPFLQALSSGASKKNQKCERKTPARGVSCMSWWAWGDKKWHQMCPPVYFPEPHQCSLSSDKSPHALWMSELRIHKFQVFQDGFKKKKK